MSARCVRTLPIFEKYYTQITAGLKTKEARICYPSLKSWKAGDLLKLYVRHTGIIILNYLYFAVV